MATSTGQYTPIFLPGETPSLTEKPGRPQCTGFQRVRHDQSDPPCIDAWLSCLWQLCPSESWARSWCSCLACGDPVGTKCAGTRTASATRVMALLESFYSLLYLAVRRPLHPVFLCSSTHSALSGLPSWGPSLLSGMSGTWRGPAGWDPTLQISAPGSWRGTLGGVLLCGLKHQSLKESPWVGSCSVVQWMGHLMGQSLYCSANDAGVWGERGYGDCSISYVWLSSTALLPWLPGFSPVAFPTTVSSRTSPRSLSPQWAAVFTLWLLHNPQTPAPSHCAFQGTSIPVVGMYVWFSFHLGCHRSAVSLSALMFLLWLKQLPRCGNQTPASVSPPIKGRSSSINTVFFP